MAVFAVASLTLAVSQSGAAVLKWKAYRKPEIREERPEPTPVDKTAQQETRPRSESSPKKLGDEIQQVAARQAEKEDPLADPLADPFEDGAIPTKKDNGKTADEPAELEPDSIDGAPRGGPDTGTPDKLEPAEDYFPEERVPSIDKREELTLPSEEGSPDTGSPSMSDELRGFEEAPSSATDCKAEKADCADALAKLKANTLANIDLNITIGGVEGQDFPCECAFGVGETFEGRNWTCVTYNWKASGLCHKPLYFEQVAVERYGHSAPTLVQDVLCGAHFFASIPALPYMMGLCPPDECQYSLGYYRPGNCAPYLIDPIPLSLRAGLFEAGAIVGGILIIP